MDIREAAVDRQSDGCFLIKVTISILYVKKSLTKYILYIKIIYKMLRLKGILPLASYIKKSVIHLQMQSGDSPCFQKKKLNTGGI
ncbi:MAG: hypothetical protein KH452_13510, partial [Clostridiales bacterium]|nr:hypothetical protein [Clostridiales bacterium]